MIGAIEVGDLILQPIGLGVDLDRLEPELVAVDADRPVVRSVFVSRTPPTSTVTKGEGWPVIRSTPGNTVTVSGPDDQTMPGADLVMVGADSRCGTSTSTDAVVLGGARDAPAWQSLGVSRSVMIE